MNIKIILDKLKNEDLIVSFDNCNKKIDYISYDSRDIKENTLFICKGVNFKEEYLKTSIEKGIVAYISEKKYEVEIPSIIVKDIRKALSVVSQLFYKDSIYKIGITGTKGKTTTNYFIHNILTNHLGYKPGILATHYYYTGKEEGENHLTTPESLELHKYLKDMTEEDLKYVTMEVSSQATKHRRVYGMKFDIGIFLNIKEDHISELEHPNFEDYFNCKLEFIKNCDTVILYKDMEHYEEVLETVKNKKVITFGFKEADYIISEIENKENLTFKLNNEKYELEMPGRFNVINASSAIIVGKLLNISYKDIFKGLLKTKVEGRMNIIKEGVAPVIIDYAHNALSAEALYKSLKEDYAGRKIKVLFGCPGDKGVNRRKEMGSLAGKYADYIYLTSEDPGNQTVIDICNDIVKEIKPYNKPYEIIEDRKTAIIKALKNLTENDVLALLGKGDENYQIIKDKYIPYETDIEIVKSNIKALKEI